MYLMNTRPNICFVVNTLSQYLVKPRWFHLIVAKHVMRYLKGTIDFGLYYVRDHDYRLYRYTDSDWVGSVADRKSTLDGCYCLGSTMISWFSQVFLSIQLKKSTWKLSPLFGKPYGFEKMMSQLFYMELDTTLFVTTRADVSL